MMWSFITCKIQKNLVFLLDSGKILKDVETIPSEELVLIHQHGRLIEVQVKLKDEDDDLVKKSHRYISESFAWKRFFESIGEYFSKKAYMVI